jgi:hypothetical protein
LVKHRIYPFRGVIFDVDPVFANTEEWLASIPIRICPAGRGNLRLAGNSAIFAYSLRGHGAWRIGATEPKRGSHAAPDRNQRRDGKLT